MFIKFALGCIIATVAGVSVGGLIKTHYMAAVIAPASEPITLSRIP